MVKTSMLAWAFSNVLTYRRYEMLKKRYGNLERAGECMGEALLQSMGCKHDRIPHLLRYFQRAEEKALEQALERTGTTVTFLEDPAYPSLLKAIHDPPVFLFTRGDVTLLRQRCVGIVGTRKMTNIGRDTACMFARTFVEAGIVTVSGLALGIDGQVARATIDASGRTIACLGHGLDFLCPAEHRSLAEEILGKGGVLLAECPPSVRPDRYTFPARNRIIAGLSSALLVVEAPMGSGALITASFALDQGRNVYAVPGPLSAETFAGCNTLIATQGAGLALSPEHILRDIGIMAVQKIRPAEAPMPLLPPEQRELFASIDSVPKTVDEILARCTLPPSSAGVAMTMLEIAGYIRNVGCGRWVRT